VVRTQTDAHADNPGAVLSDPSSPEVQGTTTGSPPATHLLTVAPAGGGDGMVTSTPVGIECGGTCSELFLAGSTVTLYAQPLPGSVFVSWSGAGCSGAGSCQVTMTGPLTVTATFEPEMLFHVFSDGFESGDALLWSHVTP
jgi:hypothetical protein